MDIFGQLTTRNISMTPANEEGQQLLEALYWSLALERHMCVSRQRVWATEATSLDAISDSGNVLMAFDSMIGKAAMVELKDAIALVWLSGGNVFTNAAAKTRVGADAALETVRRLFPKALADESTVRFAFHTHKGVTHRPIEAPTWEAIRENYPRTTREHLQQLIARQGGAAPELLLWHGLPGTGKTFALRALGREWRRWCDFHYILDPEVFFGPDSTYMLKTVTEDLSFSDKRRWRLLIAEDTGELLARDAKERMGQGLSRLLNLVDGLIGQGLRIMVLITTNEQLSVMHDAVVRPGRCSGPLQFQPFSAPEATAWLAHHGKPPLPGTKPRTLAELFSGRDVASNAIGFASPEAA